MFSFFFGLRSSSQRQSGSQRILANRKTTASQQMASNSRAAAPHAGIQQEKQRKQEQEFAEMERSLHRIHYFFQKADMPLLMRQVLTYRKLMELDYFTPQAAKELIRQWQQQEEASQQA